ncbi:MAG TPA: hypothetical protein V6D00_12895 [Pantanalinema sp.]
MKHIGLIITPLMALALMGAGAANAIPSQPGTMTLAAQSVKTEKKTVTKTTKSHKKVAPKGGGGGEMKREHEKAQKHMEKKSETKTEKKPMK